MPYSKFLASLFFATSFLCAAGASAASDPLTGVLEKMDGLICAAPEKMTALFGKNIVIFSDDKRILPKQRIESYQNMIAELEGMKCKVDRTVLSSSVGKEVGYILVDEQISVSSRQSTDERQHSVCTYVFNKEGGAWKIIQEHCSSLPDYTIVPGDDALYYYHNPVY